MKNVLSLRVYSTHRRYFDDDVLFHLEQLDVLETLLDKYEEAARLAYDKANTAVRSGKRADLREAQWYEAITETFESILEALPFTQNGEFFAHMPDELDIPEPPSFEEREKEYIVITGKLDNNK